MMNILKIAVLTAFIALVMISCKDSEDRQLEKLKTELEEKKEKFEALRIEIQQLEEEVASLSDENGAVTGRTITTREVELRPFTHYIEVQGLVEADQNITVTSEMNGVVNRILVREGDKVTRGQVLAHLNDEIVRRNIDEVNTSLGLATITYERQKNLWEQNIGSEIQYLQAKNQKESLENNLATLNTQLSKLKITSPVDGVVDEIFIKLGDMMSPGTRAIRVVNLDKVYVKADVPERFLKVVYKGEDVLVRFPAIGVEMEAEINAVGQFINPGNRTFKVDIRLDNKDLMLKPNLLSVVRINDYHKENAVVIPTHLVQHYFDEEFVFVIDKEERQKIARKRVIQTGKTYGGYTEILEGLIEGELLIDAGFRDIANGQKVQIKQ